MNDLKKVASDPMSFVAKAMDVDSMISNLMGAGNYKYEDDQRAKEIDASLEANEKTFKELASKEKELQRDSTKLQG